MKLEFYGKSLNYNLDGSLKGTVVTLGHMDGGHLPVLLAGDQTALSNQELFELAMEEHYQENFPNRAENEKFNLLGEKIAEYNKLIEKATLTIDKMETQMTTQQEQSSMAQVTLMSVIFKLYEKGILTDEDLAETTISEVEQSHETIRKRNRHDD